MSNIQICIHAYKYTHQFLKNKDGMVLYILVWKSLFFHLQLWSIFSFSGNRIVCWPFFFQLKMSFDCLLISVNSFEKLALGIIVDPFKTRITKLWPVHLCMRAQSLSSIWFYVNIWTGACQAPLSVEFSRQEYRSGLPFPASGDLPNPGIEPKSLASPVLATDSLLLHHLGNPLHVSPFSKNQECIKNYIEIVQSIKLTLKNRL